MNSGLWNTKQVDCPVVLLPLPRTAMSASETRLFVGIASLMTVFCFSMDDHSSLHRYKKVDWDIQMLSSQFCWVKVELTVYVYSYQSLFLSFVYSILVVDSHKLRTAITIVKMNIIRSWACLLAKALLCLMFSSHMLLILSLLGAV